ncbi:hypothetical protein D1007_30589 [Hordeum vulgare]|nr:hypothetical protein D1007_30589 [Hordeum vulgare]
MAADEAGGGDSDKENPLVGPGRPRRRRCSRLPFFFLQTSVYVCSSTSDLTASRVKTLTPVGGSGVLDVVTFVMGSAQEALGYVGQISALIVVVMPACTTLRDIWNEGSVGQRSPLPFLAALFNCGVWILCGLIAGNEFVFWLSIVGACFQASYFTFYLFYCTAGERRWWIGGSIAMFLAYALLLVLYFTEWKAWFDVLCALSGVVLAATPLLNIPAACKSMNIRCMPPLPVPLASLVNGAICTAYACAGTEVLHTIAVSNVAAVVSAVIQILLHASCYVIEWPELQEFDVPLMDEEV